jgi:hypothetical protein
MAEARDLNKSSNSSTPDDPATLVAWTASTGDATKSHVVHVDPAGMAWALNLTEPHEFGQLVGMATARPAEAAALIEAHERGHRLPRERLARVAYAEQLNQLTVVDRAGKKQRIEYGKEGEQGKIFAAVGRHLGGTAREEDADAWSVMQVPLLALAVTSVIGGFMIWFCYISDPNAEMTGRRQGMKTLLNWLGYTIGPTWMSIAVGVIAALILAFMIFLLVKRPKRQVLEF